MIRVLSGTMSAVFALATIVQLNDPDALRWMILYGAACAMSLRVAVRRPVPVAIAGGLGLLALVWGLWLGHGVYGRFAVPELFEAWEMKDTRIEEAREAGGLLLAGGWLLFLAATSQRTRSRQVGGGGRTRPPSPTAT